MKEKLDLRNLRGNKTLAEVAVIIKITPQMLGKIEMGKRTPSLLVATRIANYYNLIVDNIFFAGLGDDLSLKIFSQLNDETRNTVNSGKMSA